MRGPPFPIRSICLLPVQPEQLGLVIDYCENKFADIDAIMVIFGSTGLDDVFDAYEVLHQKWLNAVSLFPILPSLFSARREVEYFLSKGHINFPMRCCWECHI
jgi:acetate---CoA ligase (ADP-forming)